MNIKPIFKKDDIVGDYTIKFFIERNDGGEIYRVKDLEGNLRRLKVYAVDHSSISRFCIERISKESEILSEIAYPNIERLEFYGEILKDSIQYYIIVTDFISGETCLDKLQREGALNPYEVVPLIISLLESIDYLHSLKNPIIHNDLSIENIILNYADSKEIPIITNFSSALHLSNATNYFDSSLLNPYYMAPEQMKGITMPQSDLFSVGVLMYHLCFGVTPWIQESELRDELLEKIAYAREAKLRFTSNPIEILDEHILSVMNKALQSDVSKRFSSAKEFIAALNREVVLSVYEAGKYNHPRKRKGNGFADIAGMNELKDILKNDVIRALKEKELYKSYGITIPNGMLLYGPPGCGKTFVSEKFAEELGFNYSVFKPSDVISKYVNGTEENIGKIFNEAKEHAPFVLFFDEIDSLVPSRDNNLHHMNASTVNEFLAQLSNCADEGVFVIAATNRPDKIDSAILRTGRMDKKVYVGPPDKIARELMFKLYLKDRPTDFSIEYSVLADNTDCYIASDIKYVVDEASRYSLRNNARISQEIILKTINKSTPSLSMKEIERYSNIRDIIEVKQLKSNGRRPIGFRK